MKTAQKFGGHVRRSWVEPPDDRHRRLLRLSDERPDDRSPTEQRDEVPPPHVEPPLQSRFIARSDCHGTAWESHKQTSNALNRRAIAVASYPPNGGGA